MKAVLEFDYDNMDDKRAHLRAVKSLDMAFCLFNIKGYVRSRIKYSDLPDDVYKQVVEIQDYISEIMHEHGIDLDELLE